MSRLNKTEFAIFICLILPKDITNQNLFTLKKELSGTKAYKETSKDDKSVVFRHSIFPASLNFFALLGCLVKFPF